MSFDPNKPYEFVSPSLPASDPNGFTSIPDEGSAGTPPPKGNDLLTPEQIGVSGNPKTNIYVPPKEEKNGFDINQPFEIVSATPEQTAPTIALPQATPQELAKTGEKPTNVFEQALNKYPVLKNANPVGLISTNTPDGDNMLESWKAGEEGTKERPRPMGLPKDQLGVQIFSPKTTADDVAADIVSHHLVNTDPTLKVTYNQFASTITPDQRNFLMGDYENEVKQATLSGGERPPAFDQWLQQTGIPSAFRGYAFNQYKPEDQKEFGYTDQQKQLLGGVKTYLENGETKRPVGFFEGAGRGLVGGLAKANELMAQGVGVFPYMEDKTLQAFGVDSNIYNRYMKAVHATGLGKPAVEAEAIKPSEYLTTGGQIGQGLGEMTSSLPYMIGSGGVGAEATTAQEAFQVVKPLMTPIRQGIQSMLPMATQAGAETVQQSAQQGDNPVTQAAKGIASATATAVTGAIPLSMRSKIANPLARFLEQGAYGYITGLGVGESQKVVDSWINGKPYIPSSWKDMAIQAIPMAFMTGLFGVIHAPEPQRKVLPEPAPEVAPSNVAGVNEKEAQITATADALHETPPVTQEQKTSLQEELNKKTLETPEEKEKIRDQELSSKWDEMMSHPEGSPEREKAFQEYIDISSGKVKPTETSQAKPTAEAPVAEAQPETTNATKTGEVKESNQPEHPNRDETRQATETSSGDSTVTGEKVQEEVIGKTLLPEDRLFISDLSKNAKEKIISVGAASPEEFMQRYAIIGAKTIMDGHQSLGRFSSEIMKEIPSLNPDLINEVYTRAGELINQLESGGGEKPTPIQRFLEKKPKAPQETITINPKTELKKSLREQQKAGEAGYRRGVKESWNEAKEIISGLNAKIKDSITKAQALSEYLRGQEKGAKIATDTFRRNIKSADKILSHDQEDVRRDLTELVKKLLPPSERGRFIGAITKALKRPNILTGDPMTMYKNAANVMTAIRAKADEVYRKGVIGEIRDTVDRALKSPSVDLQFKNLISKALKDVNIKTFSSARLSELKSTRDYLNRMEEEGKDVYIPKQILDAVDQIGKTPIKDLPIETLENLNTKLKLMERLGRMKFKSREASREAEEQLRMSEILKGDSMPLEKNPEFKAQPGEKLTFGERVSNRLARFYNATTSMDIAHLPQDVIFDWLQGMKGKYSGPLFDHIRTPVDSAYDAVQRNTISATDPLKDIIKHYKLTDQDEEKIGLWAQLQQERGEKVALETGVTPKTINDLKASGLTNGQKAAYNYMRRILDSTLPRIQETMHNLYNVPVEAVKNYFPWMRDYEKYNTDPAQPIFDATTGKQISQEELDSFSNLVGNLFNRNTAKTPQGFTIERKPGATPAIRYDAFDVFQRHMYNANRLIELQPTARMASKMINSDSFKEKFGDYGQQLLKEWMTHTVTDGQGGNIHRLQLLDWARKGSSKGLVFFNVVSNIKHISAIPQGFLNAGSPSNWWSGMHLQHTSEGEAFLKNFPQLTQRGAGELSFSELQKNLMKDPEGIFPKTMSIADRYGFVVGRLVDEINSRSVFIGRYLDNLKQKGINPSLKGPIDEKAAYNAMAYMRRTVSSTLPKDIQPVLGKGAGFGGNVSLARTMNAFKQFALERWSLMRYDIPAAFKSGNYTKGVATIAACLAAGIYETQLPGVLKGMSQGIFGKPTGQKEDKETWYQKLLMDSLTMIPYVSIPVSMALYKDAGIPIVDVVRNMAMSGYGVATAKTGEGTKNQLINLATATGELAGVPGSAVLGKGAKAMFVNPELQKKETAQVAKLTRQEKASTRTTNPHTIKTIGGIKPIRTIR